MHYLDTSALVKRYIREPGAENIDRLFEDNLRCAGSVIIYAEIYASLQRLLREGAVSADTYDVLAGRFEEDFSSMLNIEFTPAVRSLVSTISKTVTLKGSDLIHLVSAISLARRTPGLTFVCSDRQLLRAAAAQNLDILDPAA